MNGNQRLSIRKNFKLFLYFIDLKQFTLPTRTLQNKNKKKYVANELFLTSVHALCTIYHNKKGHDSYRIYIKIFREEYNV